MYLKIKCSFDYDIFLLLDNLYSLLRMILINKIGRGKSPITDP